MIKNNVFRGILYTFLTAMMLFIGIQAIQIMGGTLEMTAVELYTTLGWKGMLILAGIVFFGINTLVFAVNNYKQFVYTAANRVDKRKAGVRVFAKVYKTLIAGLLLAGIVILFTKQINIVELAINGDIKTVALAALTMLAVVLMLAFEFAELIYTIKITRGPKRPKVKKAKKTAEPVAPKATEVQEKPVFKFGNKR